MFQYLTKGLITGILIFTIYDYFTLHNKSAKKVLDEHLFLIKGYHFHHSVLGILLIITGVLLYTKVGVELIGFGVAIIIVHTWFDGHFVFIEKLSKKNTESLMDQSKKHKKFNNRFFAKWAPFYDIIEVVLKPLRVHVAKMLKLPKGSRIIDIAAGTGSQSLALANEGYKVTGIDLSPDMLEKANKKIKSGIYLRFRNLDATNTPYESHYFDAATISLGIHDMPFSIEQKVLKETKRVVKKGGLILIVDHLEPSRHWLINFLHPLILRFETPNYLPFVQKGLKKILKESNLDIEKSEIWHGMFQVVKVKNR